MNKYLTYMLKAVIALISAPDNDVKDIKFEHDGKNLKRIIIEY